MQPVTITIETGPIDTLAYLEVPIMLWIVTGALTLAVPALLVARHVANYPPDKHALKRALWITGCLAALMMIFASAGSVNSRDQIAQARNDQLIHAMEQRRFSDVEIASFTGNDDSKHTTYKAKYQGRAVQNEIRQTGATTYVVVLPPT